MLKKTISLSVLFALINPAWAFTSFEVKNVVFEGLDHISAQTAEAHMPKIAGKMLTPDSSSLIIEDLYKTGFFSDIHLYRRANNTLLVEVHEQPTIAKITFSGNDAIPTKSLKQVLQSVGLLSGNIYDPTILNQVVQSLKAQYYAQGKYAVRVTPFITPLPRNRVAIALEISEGLSNQIRTINIVGNRAFSESALIKQLVLTTPTMWSFFTDNDVYSEQKLNKSLDALRNFYMDRGYINYKVDSTQTSVNPQHTQVYLTINISEGSQYKFAGYDLSGDVILPKAQLNKLVTIQKGDIFSRKVVMASVNAMTTALGDKGYAFAKIDPVPVIDEKAKTVKIDFQVNPGRRTYIRHINFMGNAVTNDKALRQNLKYDEESLYSKSALDSSLMSLKRLPYLQSVDQSFDPVSGSLDQVDVNYKVTERSVNTIQASIGYSELDKIIFGVSLGLPNLFGTGNNFSINTQLSRSYKTLNLQFTQPYFTPSGIQQSVSFYFTQIDNADRDLANYSTNSAGATLSYAIPLSDTDFFHIGGGVDRTKLLQPSMGQSATVSQFLQDAGRDVFNTYSLTLGWSRDTTNDAFFPTEGVKSSLSTNVALPMSNLTWYKISSSLAWFAPITKTLTFSLDGGVNYGNGYGKTDRLPFFDNFLGGGWGTVRGYSAGSLGPKDLICDSYSGGTCTNPQAGNAIGGNLGVNASLNLFFPVPFASDNPNMRLGVFTDAGNVYDTYDLNTVVGGASLPHYPTIRNLRYSAGVAFEWLSPLGPLAFSIAKPLNEKAGDQAQFFQFTIGTSF